MKTKGIIFFIFIVLQSNIFSQNKISGKLSEIADIVNSQNNFEFIKIKKNKKFTNENFFELNSSIYKYNEYIDYKLITIKSDELGFYHYRYIQTYKNIEIEEADYILHEKNNRIISANGSICFDFYTKNTNPQLSEKEALQKALEYVNAKKYAWEEKNNEKINFEYPKGKLIYTRINDTLPINSQSYVLAYKFDIFSLISNDKKVIYSDKIIIE